MLEIIHKWGADYLRFDEPLLLTATTLTSPHGINLQPGQIITQIGHKRRSSFKLLPGHIMTYEGLLYLDQLCYAIFHCPAHNRPQMALFGPQVQYRYAFVCVFVEKNFQCFLTGPGGPKGMSDIQLDYLA
jgi:hypothetical protein